MRDLGELVPVSVDGSGLEHIPIFIVLFIDFQILFHPGHEVPFLGSLQ